MLYVKPLQNYKLICTFKKFPEQDISQDIYSSCWFSYDTCGKYFFFLDFWDTQGIIAVLLAFHPDQWETHTFSQKRVPLSRAHQKTCLTITPHAFILITVVVVQTSPLNTSAASLWLQHRHFDLILDIPFYNGLIWTSAGIHENCF